MTHITAQPKRSQAWFPGKYVPLHRLGAVEILPSRFRTQVQIEKTTLHGNAADVMTVGVRMIRAAIAADPALASALRSAAPELSGAL